MDNLESATMVLERPVIELPAVENPPVETELKSTCCHYWLIDKPNGPLSHGVCKFCHEEREFSNSPPQYSTRNGMRRNFDIPNRKQLIGSYRGPANQMF
jgi:hypothetical protein